MEVLSVDGRRALAATLGWFDSLDQVGHAPAVVLAVAADIGRSDESDPMYWDGPFHVARAWQGAGVPMGDLPKWGAVCAVSGLTFDTTKQGGPRWPVPIQGQWVAKALADVIVPCGLSIRGFIGLCKNVSLANGMVVGGSRVG
jgi:hypothetical protein